MKFLIDITVKWKYGDPIPISTTTTSTSSGPIDPEFVDIQNEWDAAMANPNIDTFYISGKVKVPVIKTATINRILYVRGSNNAILRFGVENYNKWSDPVQQDDYLFYLVNGARVYIENVDICQPPQLTDVVEPWRPALFLSVQDPNAKWIAIIKNCNTSVLGRNGGFGLGFVYGGIYENHIAAIDYNHAGSTFLDGKAAIGGSQNTILYITLDNVITDDSNPEEFGTWKIPVQAVINNELFTITSEHNTDQIRGYYLNDVTIGNYAYIIHLDRFTFMLKPSNVIDLKNIQLYPIAKNNITIRVYGGKVYTIGKEGHAGDSFTYNSNTYTTIEKGRDDYPRWANSDNNPALADMKHIPYLVINTPLVDGYYNVVWTSSFNQDSIVQNAYMIYKESSYGFRSYVSTLFEDAEIMQGGVVGHTFYNHRRISAWWRNVFMSAIAYYRQTDPGGLSLGYNMINCQNFGDQFNPGMPITQNVEMPMAVKGVLDTGVFNG